MGSALSLLTPQNLAAAAILTAVVASAWYGHANASSSTSLLTGQSTPRSKKGKKKRATSDAQDMSTVISEKEASSSLNIAPSSGLAEQTVPGGIPEPDVETAQPVPKVVKEKKRKGKKPVTPTSSSTNPETAAGPSTVSTNSGSVSAGRSQGQKRVPASVSEEPWTRVESRRHTSGQNLNTSDAGITTASATEEDGSSSGTLEKAADRGTPQPSKTFAEKMLPKGRRTAVDDMLDTSQYPELSRVMRVTPREDEKPASGFSWGDYEDVEDTQGADADGEDDGGWGVVKSRGKAKHSQSLTSAAVAPQPKASETLTKKQRQNAAKREAAKIAKAEAEADRLAQLAKHKRDLERARIAEQYSHKGGNNARSNISGGMSATVDEKGKLVWD